MPGPAPRAPAGPHLFADVQTRRRDEAAAAGAGGQVGHQRRQADAVKPVAAPQPGHVLGDGPEQLHLLGATRPGGWGRVVGAGAGGRSAPGTASGCQPAPAVKGVTPTTPPPQASRPPRAPPPGAPQPGSPRSCPAAVRARTRHKGSAAPRTRGSWRQGEGQGLRGGGGERGRGGCPAACPVLPQSAGPRARVAFPHLPTASSGRPSACACAGCRRHAAARRRSSDASADRLA
jgi:hypothetical protein